MVKVTSLVQDRNFILLFAMVFGLIWGKGAQWTEQIILPALAVVMTLSMLSIPTNIFRPLRAIIAKIVTGILLNYLLLGGLIIGLSTLLIHDDALWNGFVIIAIVPPAVAVVPFTFFLDGNVRFSLIGTIGAYLGALIITPLLAFFFLVRILLHPTFKVEVQQKQKRPRSVFCRPGISWACC